MRITTLVAAVALNFSLALSADAGTLFQDDFDGLALGNLNGQNGWTATVGNPQVVVGDTGGTDHVLAGTSGIAQGDAFNAPLFSTAGARSFTITTRQRLRSGQGNRVFLTDAAGNRIIGFGAGFGGTTGFVIADPAGTPIFESNFAPGNENFLVVGGGASHQWFNLRFTVNFNGDADATGTLEVDRFGDGFDTLLSDVDLDLAPQFELSTNFAGLAFQLRNFSDRINNVLLTQVVPEPSTGLLLGLGLFGLVSRRKTRSRVEG